MKFECKGVVKIRKQENSLIITIPHQAVKLYGYEEHQMVGLDLKTAEELKEVDKDENGDS